MTTTFYGVLGVNPDADADAIRRGYRERAAEVHPDVNDDPDADSQFRRLTTARDTLLDETERARYDRLGHASYVRHHVSGSAWEVGDRAGNRSADRRSGRSTREPGSADRHGPVSGGRSDPGGQGARRASRTGTASEAGSGSAPNGGESGAGHRRATGPRGGNRRNHRATGSRPPGAAASGSRVDGETRWGSRGPSRGTGEEAGGSGSVGDAYATSTFWDTQRVGERHGTGTGRANSPLGRVVRGVRALGPWVVVHAVFLTVALGTSWYAYAVVLADTTRPLALLVALVGAMTLAVLLSTLHVVSRVYR